jgi:acyl carrier protein
MEIESSRLSGEMPPETLSADPRADHARRLDTMRETQSAVTIHPAASSGSVADTTATVLSVLRGIRALQSNGIPYEQTTNLTDAGFTSLEMVQVMLATEAAFDIMIPQHMITTDNFSSASSIASMVDQLIS